MGLPKDEASALSIKLANAEAPMDPKILALFASFEGTVMVEGDEDHSGHSVHKNQGK
jgi:hypothetical protein